MEDIIKTNKLCKIYEFKDSSLPIWKRILHNKNIKIKALIDFTVSIGQGEIVGVLGLNGAGKTTLIKMLTGILTPSSGEIDILGFDPQKNRYKYTYNIGVVMGQKSLLFPNIAVKESLLLYKNIYEISDIDYDNRLKKFNKIFKIDELLEIPVRKLSLGQRMKCEIVASILHNPKILFLDEPTIGLDIISKNQIYEMLLEMNRELKTTIILTTHNLNDVDILCKRIILIDKGKKIYDGDKTKIENLNTDREIILRGSFENIGVFFNKYEYIDDNCIRIESNKEDLSNDIKIISNLEGITDIKIQSKGLEKILESIYKGYISI